MRYRATLAYDGSAYWGFQRQAGDIPTIQAAVEAAIHRVTGTPATVIGAGRTDSGVHANGQVISFEISSWRHEAHKLLKALNHALPDDIRLRDVREAPGFHPRYDALSRRYSYTVIETEVCPPLMRNRAWCLPAPLDTATMQAAATLLVGEHDFATFGHPPQGSITTRVVVQSIWTARPDPWGRYSVYTVEANAFLHHMVRRMVGMMVELGRGRLSISEFEARFRAADLSKAKRAAPPQGLILEEVLYPD